jgi:hypothetical protein
VALDRPTFPTQADTPQPQMSNTARANGRRECVSQFEHRSSSPHSPIIVFSDQRKTPMTKLSPEDMDLIFRKARRPAARIR